MSAAIDRAEVEAQLATLVPEMNDLELWSFVEAVKETLRWRHDKEKQWAEPKAEKRMRAALKRKKAL